jgi:hypothetical protein
MRSGGVLPPTPVLAPGSALGSRPRVALSSARAPAVYRGPRPQSHRRSGRSLENVGNSPESVNPGPDDVRCTWPLWRRRTVHDVRLRFPQLIKRHILISSTIGVMSATGLRSSEATDLSCHLSLCSFAPTRERPQEYRGARAGVIGKISDTATSAVVFPRDTLEATGLSYPIGSVPGRP